MGNSDTKTALLDVAQNLIRRVGVNAMSYNDLSEAVGIRKASIHYHFPRKDDLIKALLCRCGRAYTSLYLEIIESDCSAKTKLYMISDIYENGVKEDKLCLIGMLSVEYASLNESIQDAINDGIRNSVKIFEKIFLQGLQENTFSKKRDTYDAAYGFMSFLLGAQILSRSTKSPEGFRTATEVYIESLFTL